MAHIADVVRARGRRSVVDGFAVANTLIHVHRFLVTGRTEKKSENLLAKLNIWNGIGQRIGALVSFPIFEVDSVVQRLLLQIWQGSDDPRVVSDSPILGRLDVVHVPIGNRRRLLTTHESGVRIPRQTLGEIVRIAVAR